jgi:hypothetical protein
MMEAIFLVLMIMFGLDIIIKIIEVRKLTKNIPIKEKVAYITRVLQNLAPLALILVTEAEIQFGEKTGPFKRSYVLDELYKRVPDEYKKYITEENLDAIIEITLPKAEELWATNPLFMGDRN